MVGSAHLAGLKALSLRFLHFMSQRFEAESHLRAPTVLEAQQADAKLWQLISSLVHDKAFSLNDALFEVTEVRGDLSSLLQPRPRVPSIPAMIHAKEKFKGSGKSSLPQPTASTKGDKGSGKSSSNPPSRPKWVTSFIKDGKKLQLCMQFHSWRFLQVLPWLRLPEVRWNSVWRRSWCSGPQGDNPLTTAVASRCCALFAYCMCYVRDIAEHLRISAQIIECLRATPAYCYP